MIPKGLQNESCSSITMLYATQDKQKKLSLNISIKNHFHVKATGKCHGPVHTSDAQKFNQKFELQENLYLNLDDLWSDILVAALFAMCSTYHTTLHDAWSAHIWEGYDT